MNYFLILIILGLCGGGYYEYTNLQTAQQDTMTSDQQVNDKLRSENKKLEDANTALTKSASEAQAAIADLTTQLQNAQSGLALAKQAAAAKASAPAPPPATTPAAPPAPTNNLGTIATLDGKSYQNCQLLKVDADGITVNHSEGITKIVFGLLPPDLQKRFGYDPHQATALTEAQVEYQEEQRKAAAQATGN